MAKSRESRDDAERRLSEASAVLEDAAAKLQVLVSQVREALVAAGVKPNVGEQGPRGPKGEQGPRGPQGPSRP